MHKPRHEVDTFSRGASQTVRCEFADDMAIMVNTLGPGTDQTPFLRSLAAGSCEVPHWGYMIEGSVTVGYVDGTEETIRAGEVFYLPSGHDVIRTDEGCEFVEVSPAEGLKAIFAEATQKRAAKDQTDR
jgi:hypothetical protein